MEGRIRIIGVGNGYRGDDGAGLRLAKAIGEALSGSVSVMEQSGEGAGLLAAMEGADAAVICDAAASGAPPGTLHRIDAGEPLPQGLSLFSTHAFGVSEAIELGRVLGTLPPHILVYGIEGACFDAGTELSAEVEAAIPEAARQAAAELRALLEATGPTV